MVEITLRPFIRCIILKVDMFETHIINEANFSPSDEAGIEKFTSQYIDDDNYVVIQKYM